MKSMLNAVLAVTLLVPTAGFAADATIEQMVQDAGINQATINAATEDAVNVYSVNAPKNVAQRIYPTERNVVSATARKVGRGFARLFSSNARQKNTERQTDIEHGVIKPVDEYYTEQVAQSNIDSSEMPQDTKQRKSVEIFGEQPGIFTRGYNAVSNAASAFKNYAMTKYAENGRGVFVAKAAGITALGVAAIYATYKVGKYAYKKLVKKSSKKKIKKIAAGVKRAVKKA